MPDRVTSTTHHFPSFDIGKEGLLNDMAKM